MGILIDGAIFNYDGSDLSLAQLLKKLESVGLEMGASTQPIDSEGNLYKYTDGCEAVDMTEVILNKRMVLLKIK